MKNSQFKAMMRITKGVPDSREMMQKQFILPDGRLCVSDGFRAIAYNTPIPDLPIADRDSACGYDNVGKTILDALNDGFSADVKHVYPMPGTKELQTIKKKVTARLNQPKWSAPPMLIMSDKTDGYIHPAMNVKYLIDFSQAFGKGTEVFSAKYGRENGETFALFFHNEADDMDGLILPIRLVEGYVPTTDNHKDSVLYYDYWVSKNGNHYDVLPSPWESNWQEKEEDKPVSVNPCLHGTDPELADKLENKSKEEPKVEDEVLEHAVVQEVEEAPPEIEKPKDKVIQFPKKGKEESKPSRQEKLEECNALLDRGIDAVFESDTYANYMAFCAKLHRYSFRNQILIYMQMPNASYVAGYKTWEKMGGHVKKGEKSLKIYAPMIYKKAVNENEDDDDEDEGITVSKVFFRPVPVFDISQTVGVEVPESPFNLSNGNTGEIEGFDNFVEALKRVSPVPVEFGETNPGSLGCFYVKGNKIVIKEGLSQLDTINTMVHEITHATLHYDGCNFDTRTKEVQAESVAFIVCKYFGLDCDKSSFGYVASWSSGKEKKELKMSLRLIQQTSNHLIEELEKELGK